MFLVDTGIECQKWHKYATGVIHVSDFLVEV